jgi:hypothetical protein
MPKVSTSWKEGESGNPNGRPKKGYSITEYFKEMLNSKPEVKDALTKSILKKALEGDTTAQKMVWNYMDGMPKQNMDLTSDGERLVFKIVKDSTLEDARDNNSTNDSKLQSSGNDLPKSSKV